MKRALLDTNAYRRLYNGDSDLLETVERCEEVYLSPVVLGELFAGFRKGDKEKQNLKWLDKFLRSNFVEVVEIGVETAKIYAQVKIDMEKKGKPIPANDIWIAAQAIETGSVLVTYDQHFKSIPGLRIWGE